MRLSLRRFGAVGAGSVLLATGATTGATSQAQTFMNSVGIGRAPTTSLDVYSADAAVAINAHAPSAASGIYAGIRLESDTVIFTCRAFSAASPGGARTNIFSTGGYMLIGGGVSQYCHIYANNAAVINVATSGYVFVGGSSTPTALLHVGASTTARASLCLAHGSAPTSPVNGDMWTTTAGLYVRINGATVGPLS